MLYGPDGGVVWSSSTTRADQQHEAAEAVRRKLKAIDSLLDIRYVEWAERYCLVVKWPQSDSRWKMYETGEIGEPFDSLGWFCEDMQDPNSLPVSVDSIENKVLERIASCDNTKTPWKARMGQVIAKNAKRRKAKTDVVSERVEDIAATLWRAAGKHDRHKIERMLQEVREGKS